MLNEFQLVKTYARFSVLSSLSLFANKCAFVLRLFFSPVTSNEYHFNYKSLLNIQSHKITPNYVSSIYRMVTERKGTICSPHPCFTKQEAMGLHFSKKEQEQTLRTPFQEQCLKVLKQVAWGGHILHAWKYSTVYQTKICQN